MNTRFDGKVAVVTGGTSGTGYACAEMLLDLGAKVAVIGSNAERMAGAVEKLQAKGTVKGFQLNLGQTADIPAAVTKIREELGEIDVLVQAAGVMQATPATELTEENWDLLLNVNAKAIFYMMKAVVEQSMIPRKSGSIVNFSSVAGVMGMAEPLCSAHYSASKGAVVQLTRQAAVEWAKFNIRTNAVAPGGIMTGPLLQMPPEMLAGASAAIPLKRFSQPSEIASGVCFLASDAASMVTGQVLVIDGGGSIVGH
jgi:NAD(P)-dependent dehydrogenase (short-subunit alcohol dehydrogenase family)